MRARGVTIVGDGGDVAVVGGAHTKIIGKVEEIAGGSVGASGGGRAGEFDGDAAGLKAIIVEVGRDDAGVIGEGRPGPCGRVERAGGVVDGTGGIHSRNCSSRSVGRVCDDAAARIGERGDGTVEVV